ncbi:MAG: 2-oxoacid:acceptor oxidoreductase subunit alpha [Sulfurovum sp.]|nr:2-oxoacid:acceptor oxidoreductase subunit alpha [Sulfurovum sp.]
MSKEKLESEHFNTINESPIKLAVGQREESASKHESTSILIGGAAGAGIMSLENVLTDAFKRSGYFVFSTKEYMSRVRGGSNTTLLRISNVPICAPCWQVDIFIALDKEALDHVQERLGPTTIVLADESIKDETLTITAMPMLEAVKEVGNLRYANAYVAGVLFAMFSLDNQNLSKSIKTLLKKQHPEENETAMQEGFSYATSLRSVEMPKHLSALVHDPENMHLLNGSSASGFGFLLGGCNMITSYPMSPSTGVLNFMASMSNEFEIVVEQSEDEIASINMVLGGWYSGARAMTSTSGGGFALMTETISLSGVSETPAVVYLAQRPGPATGLPTRTEQGDLNLAIHSGHGYFGRIVLAPGDLQECIDYAYLAVELADRYQMPVIYLSDQYLADSIAMISDVDFSAYEQRRYIQRTEASYNRYSLKDGAISPRGVPSFGEGLIVSSSHEHEERGQSTENYHIRDQMQQKRQEKINLSIEEAFKPQVMGQGDIAVIGWGSTKAVIEEVLKVLNDAQLFQVHFNWVHPLNPEHLKVLKEAKTLIVIENNAVGDFADILKSHDVNIDHRILQSNGFPFFTDLLEEKLSKILKEIR